MEKNTGNLELGLEAQNESQRSVRTTVQKDSRQKSYKLNARDAELFEFVAQMKFASLDTLFARFFSRTLTGQPSKSDWYAKERLGFLVDNGYLRTNEAITTSKRYYTTTIKGYQAAQQIMPFRELTKPIQGFDLRTFIHDRELILIREEMENQSEIVSWLSDRRLRMGKAGDYNFSSEFIPDAVVKKRDTGQYEAIELEIAYKSRARYQSKIFFYRDLILNSASDFAGVRKVNYICMRPSVFQALDEECRPYGEMFSVKLGGSPLKL